MKSEPRRSFLSATTLTAAAATLAGAAATAQAAEAKTRAVFQVSDADPAKWNLALNNVANVQQALGAGAVELEIVAYGPGIRMLQDDSVVGNRIADALAAGVAVVACQNTMKAMKLEPADMLPKIGYVPAGVVEIIQKQ
ncbi:MAG: DsrE family protein, partial [Burkholderiales bacterium]|nr:DsrE family protein [Burkholderiales bacterium]